MKECLIPILLGLFLQTGCNRTSPEFEQQWAVAEGYIKVGDCRAAAAVFGFDLNKPLERAVFQRVIAQNMTTQERIDARIFGWSEDNSNPLPYPYLDPPRHYRKK